MKEEERNKLEDVFFSKLYDIEVDTMPEDWEAIAGRLPEKAPVPFRRTLSYWVAAAVISLLVVTGSIFLYEKGPGLDPVARKGTPAAETVSEEPQPEGMTLLSADRKIAKEEKTTVEKDAQAVKVAGIAKTKVGLAGGMAAASAAGKERMDAQAVLSDDKQMAAQAQENTDGRKETVRKESFQKEPVRKERETDEKSFLPDLARPQSRSLLAEAAPASKVSSGASSRKWGIGMGAGGLSVGADHVIPQYVTNSSTLRSENLLMMNAVSFNADELPKTDIHHKVPVSFGLSVSRYLNRRFSLQTGLTYSFLSSDWKTNGDYHGKTKQKLHFIGIPLSLSYKIAEWNRFNFYASAGAMTEVNVAGKRRTQLFSDTKEINSMQERVRMKEWLWSVNARAGVSYPLIRFVSAFAEVGASYYFDNGSSIETIHSEKPFNVSLQLGFRLGF